jgi:hypothetical protein
MGNHPAMSLQSQDDQVAKQAREQIAYSAARNDAEQNMVNSVSPEEKFDDRFDDTPDTQSLRSEWG